MDLGLAGLTAVITGGSKGIGRAIADQLVAEGAHVARVERPEEVVPAVQNARDKRHSSAARGSTGKRRPVRKPWVMRPV